MAPTALIFDVYWRRKLTAYLTANIVGMKYDIDSRGTALETQRDPCGVPIFHKLWPTNADNIAVVLATLRKFCILLHCQA